MSRLRKKDIETENSKETRETETQRQRQREKESAYICVYVSDIYIYIYRERERERDKMIIIEAELPMRNSLSGSNSRPLTSFWQDSQTLFHNFGSAAFSTILVNLSFNLISPNQKWEMSFIHWYLRQFDIKILFGVAQNIFTNIVITRKMKSLI